MQVRMRCWKAKPHKTKNKQREKNERSLSLKSTCTFPIMKSFQSLGAAWNCPSLTHELGIFLSTKSKPRKTTFVCALGVSNFFQPAPSIHTCMQRDKQTKVNSASQLMLKCTKIIVKFLIWFVFLIRPTCVLWVCETGLGGHSTACTPTFTWWS